MTKPDDRLTDATAQARELARIRSERAGRLEALGTLAGGIAHDFNNILFTILGYVEMAKESLDDDAPAHTDLDDALAAVERGRQLVEQVVTFAKGDTTRRSPVDLSTVVDEAVRLLEPTVPDRVRLVTEIHSLGAMVDATPSAIQQIVTHLVRNAVQSLGARRGRVVVGVRAQREKSGEWKGTRSVRLFVADDGVGIAECDLERVFDPFYTTREPGAGQGLGLSVVHGIVRDLGGTIRLVSRLQRGAFFEVLFPASGEVTKRDPTQPGASFSRRAHVMVIDDDKFVRDLLTTWLRNIGHEVSSFDSGETAMRALRARADAFDVVVSDQTMPKMTGLDVTRRVRALRQDLPIVLCTGYSGALEEGESESAGVHSVLVKPFSQDALASALDRALFDAARASTPPTCVTDSEGVTS